MTAEAWVAILAVTCVGLLLITATAVLAWRRARVEVDEAICDREFVWGVAWETAEQRDDARDDLMRESHARVAAERACDESRTALHLALTFYGNALAIAEQSGMQYANALDELGTLRDSLDDARAALEEAI